MKINFILPGITVGGGVRVIFEYANNLVKRGHKVKIIYPGKIKPGNNFVWPIEAKLRQLKYYWQMEILKETEADWFPLRAKLLRVPSLDAKYIPSAEVVVATAVETAPWVAKLPLECGAKFYFIQGYETWAMPAAKVHATYKLPMTKIVIASWLKRLILKKTGERVEGPITNGINLKQFKNPKKIYHQPRRLLMVYSPLKIKGFKDGLKAYHLAKQQYPDLKLMILSAYPKNSQVPDEATFYHNPPQSQLKRIYSNADIFVSPSHSEGCQLPPMEAAACQTAVVATRVGGIPDYTLPNQTALVVPPKNPKALARAILKLLKDEPLLKDISKAGYQHIKQYSWGKATRKLEKVFKENLSNGKI